MADLKIFVVQFDLARCPEDIFGVNGADPAVQVQKAYRELAKKLHPDLYQGADECALAEDLFKRIQEWLRLAEQKIEQGLYGWRDVQPIAGGGPIELQTRAHAYLLKGVLHSGQTRALFAGTMGDKGGRSRRMLMAIPHSAADNDLMGREARALRAITETAGSDSEARKLAERVPALVDSFQIKEPDGKRKSVAVFGRPAELDRGWYSLEDLRRRYPEGVDGRVAAFVWNRGLEALTIAHAAGVLHRHVTPNHLLIHAETHRGLLVDWTAASTGAADRMPYRDGRYAAYFPDELAIATGGIARRSSDLYMLAWCVAYVLGGDSGTRTISRRVEKPIKEMLNRCLQPKARLRPQTAADLYQELEKVFEGLYGPKKFVPLIM